ALAVVTHACDRARGTEYHARLVAFVERIQRDDLAVSGAMTDVRGDRSRRPAAQADPDLFLRVVARDSKAAVLRGPKAHQTSAIRDKLTEMVELNETMYACALAAAVEGQPTPAGTVIPDIALCNVTKLNVTRFPFEIARLAADIAGGAMLTLPSQADLEHAELGPLVTKYMTAAP